MCCGGIKKGFELNKNYVKSKTLPEDVKQRIIKEIELIGKAIMAPPRSSIEKIFDIFNEYINAYQSDRKCSSCISAVYKFWKGAIKQWKKEKLI